jgi:SulP family sulfate permease
VLGSFFHTLPPSAGFSQSQVNTRSGARTQVSSLVTAALAVVVVLFLAPALSKLPEATLGVMVLVPVLGLIDVGAVKLLFAFDRAEGDPIEPANPLVLRTQVALYTANLRANANVVHDLVTSCDPLPKTLVLDLSRQPKVSSTILDGLREFDTEMAGLGIRVVFAALPDSACDTARRWAGGRSLQRRAGTQPC